MKRLKERFLEGTKIDREEIVNALFIFMDEFEDLNREDCRATKILTQIDLSLNRIEVAELLEIGPDRCICRMRG